MWCSRKLVGNKLNCILHGDLFECLNACSSVDGVFCFQLEVYRLPEFLECWVTNVHKTASAECWQYMQDLCM